MGRLRARLFAVRLIGGAARGDAVEQRRGVPSRLSHLGNGTDLIPTPTSKPPD